MSSSDSDDDVPLAQMQAQSSSREARDGDGDAATSHAPPTKPPPPPPTAGDSDSDSSDDVPLSKLQPQKRPRRPKEAAAAAVLLGDDDDDDDDDEDSSDSDEPIAKRKPALGGGRRRRRVVESSATTLEKKDATSTATTLPTTATTCLATLARKKSAGSAKKSPASRKPAARKAQDGYRVARSKRAGKREQAFYGTLRGKLLQEFLRRWWYAYDWPSSDAIEKEPEQGFESLAAFPGVHICTLEGDERFGKVQDHRDHATSPCFLNFYKKPSAELKALRVSRRVQMAQLLKTEPDNERYINKLKGEQRDVERRRSTRTRRIGEAVAAVRGVRAGAEGASGPLPFPRLGGLTGDRIIRRRRVRPYR